LRASSTTEAVGSRDVAFWRPVAAVTAFTLVGACFRFLGLGYRDFWFDESCSFIYVHDLLSWAHASSLLVESTNLPYYFVLRGWVSLFGDSEAAYRSLSALAATLTIPLLSLVAARLGGRVAAVVCAALVAFHPLHIHYAHEARAYAMWVFFLSIALWMLIEAGRRSRWSWWIGYGIVLLTCLHLHYFTMYWVPATVVCVWLGVNHRRVLRQWLYTHVVVGVLFLPYLITAVLPAGRGGGSAWISGAWEPFMAIPRTLWSFLPAGGYPEHMRGLSILSPDTVRLGPEWVTAAVRVIPAVVVMAIVFDLLRRKPPVWSEDYGGEVRGPSHIFLGGMTLIPLILAWLYSLFVRPNYLVGRYDLVAWPTFVVWLATCISEFARRATGRPRHWLTLAICIPMLGCSLLPIARMAALKPPPTFHNLRAERIANLARPGDLVVAFSYDRDYLLYYLHRHGFEGSIVSYPSWLDGQIGWVDTVSDLDPEKTALLVQDAIECVKQLDATIRRGGRGWLLLDSLARQGASPRVEINRRFFDALSDTGYHVDVVDVDLLIFTVERHPT